MMFDSRLTFNEHVQSKTNKMLQDNRTDQKIINTPIKRSITSDLQVICQT